MSAVTSHTNGTELDIDLIRADFPVLQQKIHGKPLVYLDNGATTQKPQAVIDAIQHYYACDNSNVHRGVHALSERATAAYEGARGKVREFLNAASTREIIFTKGTTESINLVAQSFLRSQLRPGDEILITHMEHHSNIVPWQMLCEATGATLRAVPITDAGEMVYAEFEQLLSPERTRLVALGHVSNALGTVNPIEHVIAAAHTHNIPVLIDGAQAVAHMPVDVQALDADFYAFSGHKLFGPTGIGVLYAKETLLEKMAPYQGGGDMIRTVSLSGSTWNDLPYKFEAGTPNIAGAIGLGAAIDYLSKLDLNQVSAYETALLDYATEQLSTMPGIKLIGTAEKKAGILSFVMEHAHPHDIGTIVDREGVAIRAGHHCAMPVMERFGLAATARASFACYNNRDDVDALLAALRRVQELFA